MKQRIILAAAACVACLVSCTDLGRTGGGDAEGSLVISVNPGTATKASTAEVGQEAAIDGVQYFLFSTDGSLYRRGSLGKNTTTGTLDKVKVGSYDVVAVANGPSLENIDRRETLESTAVQLGLNDPAKGFLMYGMTASPVAVSSGTTASKAEITMKRFVSRVRITTVKNEIAPAYGSLQVDDVYLINGCGDWNYGGSGSPSGYINYAGRKAGLNDSDNPVDFISSRSDAQNADLTYKTVGETVANGAEQAFNLPFYTFPNPQTASGDNFDGKTSGAVCARLVLKATFGGKTTYYPVTIENMARNKSYDVSYIIRGSGSEDPNKKVDSGNFEVVVSVDPWGDGGDIVGNF